MICGVVLVKVGKVLLCICWIFIIKFFICEGWLVFFCDFLGGGGGGIGILWIGLIGKLGMGKLWFWGWKVVGVLWMVCVLWEVGIGVKGMIFIRELLKLFELLCMWGLIVENSVWSWGDILWDIFLWKGKLFFLNIIFLFMKRVLVCKL